MHEPATEPIRKPPLPPPPLFDEDGLPVEGPPMSSEQAVLACDLESILLLHAERRGLRWHVQVNDPVGYLGDEKDEGDEKKKMAEKWRFPDLYVVRGMRQRRGRPLRLWVREPGPKVFFELSMSSSLAKDRGEKRALYQRLGVDEYFVFDVEQVGIEDVLEGYRLVRGEYRPIAPSRPDRGTVRWHSDVLDLDLEVVPSKDPRVELALRAFLPGEREPLPTRVEAEKEAEKEEALREKDEALRAAREEVERLEQELLRRRQTNEQDPD